MISFKELANQAQWGRMSNVMFEISAVLGFARKHNTDYVIPNWKYAYAFEGPFNQSDNIPNYIKWRETTYTYQEIPNLPDIDIAGYFQSRRYWEHCEDEIRQLFTFKAEIRNRLQEKWGDVSDRAAIHVRRGDYVNLQQFYVLPTMEYYTKAMAMFPDGQQFLIFSDDIPYCRSQFVGEQFSFADGDEVEDLCLMTFCKAGFIGANSSFSWWASYLGQSNKVIFPKLWFNPTHETMNHSTVDLYLPYWELI